MQTAGGFTLKVDYGAPAQHGQYANSERIIARTNDVIGLPAEFVSIEQLEGLHQVMSSPWWSRCWILKEFVVARDATFMYGDISVPTEAFELPFVLLNYLLSRLKGGESRSDRSIWKTWGKMSHDWNENIDSIIMKKAV